MNILITDDNITRRNALVHFFRIHGTMYRYNVAKGCIEDTIIRTGMWECTTDHPVFDLHLIHIGNKKFKDIAKTTARIWYGGYGYDDSRLLENEPIIKTRLLGRESFNSAQTKLLIAYVQKEGGACPDFLYIATPHKVLIEKRIKLFSRLNLPLTFDWHNPHHDSIFKGCETEWKQFKEKALDLLEAFPDLHFSDAAYQNYAELLAKLRQQTIEHHA